MPTIEEGARRRHARGVDLAMHANVMERRQRVGRIRPRRLAKLLSDFVRDTFWASRSGSAVKLPLATFLIHFFNVIHAAFAQRDEQPDQRSSMHAAFWPAFP